MRTLSPEIIAHRGGAALWPENTLGAFENAIAMGADGIEFDIQCLKDGTLVIYHDDCLRPSHARKHGQWLSPPTAFLSALSLGDLDGIDVGLDRNRQSEPDFTPIPHSPIPLFTELLALIDRAAPPHFQLYAELKTDMLDADAAERLAERFCQVITDWRPAATRLAQLSIVSFDWRCLDYVRHQFPDIRHGYTTLPFHETDPTASDQNMGQKTAKIRELSARGAPWWSGHDWRDMRANSHGEAVLQAMAAAKATGWCAYGADITEEHAKLAHELGLAIYAWTINDAKMGNRLADLGVAALITDRPDLFII